MYETLGSFSDKGVFQVVPPSEAVRDYEALLQILHGPDVEMNLSTMVALLEESSEMVIMLVGDQQIVATAQGTLCRTEPQWQVLVNNVVVHDDHQGLNHGKRVLSILEKEVLKRWGTIGSRSLKLVLTNSPKKGNGGFYEKTGFTPRIPAFDNETVVWEKYL